MPKQKPTDVPRMVTTDIHDDEFPFSVTWDDARLYRVFEAAALAHFPQLAPLSPEDLGRDGIVNLKRPHAIAREARLHFIRTAPRGLQAEFGRLLAAAYATAAAAIDNASRRAGDAAVRLPDDPLEDPADMMKRADLTEVRTRLVTDAPTDNARKIHPKAAGRPSKMIEYQREVAKQEARGLSRDRAIETVAETYGVEIDTITDHLRGVPERRSRKRSERTPKRRR